MIYRDKINRLREPMTRARIHVCVDRIRTKPH